MTNREAIEQLDYVIHIANTRLDSKTPPTLQTACKLAITALYNQEPRLLTLDELDNINVVYIEDKLIGVKCVLVSSTYGLDNCVYFVDNRRCLIMRNRNEYNKTWRCWTIKPSFELGEMTPWDNIQGVL